MSKMKIKSSIEELPAPIEGVTFIYTLLNQEECIYVGQTQNLQQRIYQHLADGKDFCDIEFFECENSEANNEEADQIVKVQPTLNKNLPTTDKYVTVAALKIMLCEEVMNNQESLGIVYSRMAEASNRPGHLYLEAERAKWLVNELADRIKSSGE
ncbi:GIY-YIG nuclease superfamily protein [Vibrio phage 1.183.O._10N.286.48.B7]|nr:GIY-YIG nuclease superfamily protein [Vibrio phage 1.183.O._10N.286.48.B7]